MQTHITHVAEAIWQRKLRFIGMFFCLFFVLYGVLYALDWLPEPVRDSGSDVQAVNSIATTSAAGATAPVVVSPPVIEPVVATSQPVSITIDSLDRTVPVLNPQSRAIADLDHALLSGVVRHPDSALLGEAGTVFILGHSSYLPTVLNKNFQAFNGIQHLAWGDTITLADDTTAYIYRVEKVYQAKASEVTVPLGGDEPVLTIATCNSFGNTDDRHIVEASLLRTEDLS